MDRALDTLLLLAILGLLLWLLRRSRPGAPAAAQQAPLGPAQWSLSDLVYQVNQTFSNTVTVPEDLAGDPLFQHLVARYQILPTDKLLSLVHGSMTVPACAALKVLEARQDEEDVVTPLLGELNDVSPYTRAFLFPVLHARARGPVLPAVLQRSQPHWQEGILRDALRTFVQARLEAGESPEAFRDIDPGAEQHEHLETLLRRLGPPAAPLLEALDRRRRGGEPDPGEAPEGGSRPPMALAARLKGRPIPHPALLAVVDRLQENLLSPLSQSTLLVGDPLVGKSAVLRVFADRIREQGWNVLERSAADLIADQSYIGQIEGRVKDLVASLQRERSVWIVPDFIDLVYAGRHSQSPTGVLEMLLPHLEAGRIRLVGEVRTASYDRLMQNVPRLRTLIESVRLAPLDPAATLDLARAWAESQAEGGESGLQGSVAPEEVLLEALHLARHYTPEGALPGSALRLLQATFRRVAVSEGGPRTLGQGDVLDTLSELTGIPASFLDDRHELDLGALRAFFSQRVLGQEEAVDCLVERITMIKAGLTDPSRPSGVFLFVGPTGTGKTAVAKALAEYLFGSQERMIRLDMSEFQSEDTVPRLVGSGGSRALDQGQSLAQAIRSQPFSVVLLDEFEKAHPRIWDLFLQVFDDGRLTDGWGQTADFRHAIIILTSNLGSHAGRGAGIGFSGKAASFSPAAVGRALEGTFRPEFLNRIDRLVVFRPLNRVTMRLVLEKELRAALGLRGLRTREWAVEWDESAMEFLLDQGFSPQFGARPLKRAIERHVLAPLAETIVTRAYPEGDQFVFVHADGDRLRARFIDPEAGAAPGEPAGAGQEAAEPAPAAPGLTLRRLAREGTPSPAALAFLEAQYRALEDRLEAPDWKAGKEQAFAAMCAPGFWSDPERFAILGLAEYRDRIEAGLRRAGTLLGRLGASRGRLPGDLVQRLAHNLYLLEAACDGLATGLGGEAFLLVEACRDSQTAPGEHDAFAREIGGMYVRWSKARGMRMTVLREEPGTPRDPYRILLDHSGYGAFPILRPEAGMHVLDAEDPGRPRARAYVQVVPQPSAPEEASPLDILRRLRESAPPDAARAAIVRRYRREPSPLVRDAQRGWRTGRLDLVLGGHFDLMED